jgi:hypothetical protein
VFDFPATGMGLSALWQVSEPAEVEELFRSYLAGIANTPGNAIMDITVKPNVARYRGVKLSTTTAVPSANTLALARVMYDAVFGKQGMLLAFGVVKQRLLVTMGSDAIARAKALIDLTKGKKSTSKTAARAALAPLLAEARRRGESYVMAMDIGALKNVALAASEATAAKTRRTPVNLVEPMAATFGATNGALTFRITVPAVQLQAVLPAPLPTSPSPPPPGDT